jgi:hypothetical protein
MTLHLDYPIVTQGHQLTGLTPVVRTKQGSQVSPLWLNQTELTGLTHVANQNPALDQIQTNHTPLTVWKVHVTHDREHDYHDSLHSTEVAQFYSQVGDTVFPSPQNIHTEVSQLRITPSYKSPLLCQG